MNNRQFDQVSCLAHELNLSLNICPTCRQPKVELAPGIWAWEDSLFKLYGEEHHCDCAWQDTLRRHYLLAGIPRDYWTLGEPEFFGDPQALKAINDYLNEWVDMKWYGMGLQLYSPTLGTGKTMLATMVGRALIQRGEHVYFIPFRDMVRTYDMPYEERSEKVNRLRHTSVLILDEVGGAMSEAQRSFFGAELEDLIRFRTSGNGITILTTNLRAEQLDKEYPRTFSLLAAKQRLIEVQGMDARRSGDLDLIRQELIANGEARPIV